MKLTASCLAVIINLLLVMHLVAARSLSGRQNLMGEDSSMTRREANSDLSSNYDKNMTSEIAQLKTELFNLSIPGYLKEMYINLTYPNGIARPQSNYEDTKFNTIQSYKNQAKSK